MFPENSHYEEEKRIDNNIAYIKRLGAMVVCYLLVLVILLLIVDWVLLGEL